MVALFTKGAASPPFPPSPVKRIESVLRPTYFATPPILGAPSVKWGPSRVVSTERLDLSGKGPESLVQAAVGRSYSARGPRAAAAGPAVVPDHP